MRFESAETRDRKPRSLLEWVSIAIDGGLMRETEDEEVEQDSWVLEYMKLTGLKANAVIVTEAQSCRWLLRGSKGR